jgi:phage host-nuclease inhibitor protein Gam
MNETAIKQKLDRLAEYNAHKMIVQNDKQRLIDAVLTDEIKAKIAEIEDEFADQITIVEASINNLQTEIKADIVSYGSSVKGQVYHAIFMKGRVSWDTKGLDGFAVAHPE